MKNALTFRLQDFPYLSFYDLTAFCARLYAVVFPAWKVCVEQIHWLQIFPPPHHVGARLQSHEPAILSLCSLFLPDLSSQEKSLWHAQPALEEWA